MEPPGVSSWAAWTPFSTLEWLVRIKGEEHGWFTAGFWVDFSGFSMGFSWILVDVQGIVVDISWILVDFNGCWWKFLVRSDDSMVIWWWFNGDFEHTWWFCQKQFRTTNIWEMVVTRQSQCRYSPALCGLLVCYGLLVSKRSNPIGYFWCLRFFFGFKTFFFLNTVARCGNARTPVLRRRRLRSSRGQPLWSTWTSGRWFHMAPICLVMSCNEP